MWSIQQNNKLKSKKYQMNSNLKINKQSFCKYKNQFVTFDINATNI